jgi:hypothetical protein
MQTGVLLTTPTWLQQRTVGRVSTENPYLQEGTGQGTRSRPDTDAGSPERVLLGTLLVQFTIVTPLDCLKNFLTSSYGQKGVLEHATSPLRLTRGARAGGEMQGAYGARLLALAFEGRRSNLPKRYRISKR